VKLPRIRIVREEQEQRSTLSFDDWAAWFTFQGQQYGVALNSGTLNQKQEEIPTNFAAYASQLYRSNGVVFACIVARASLFAEARFQFRQMRNGQPGDLFGSQALEPLETPQPSKTTADLLFEALVDVDIGGNWFGARLGREVRRLRPDWMTIVMGSPTDDKVTGWDLNAQLLGYIYQPGGPGSGRDPVVLFPEQVAHFAPYQDPLAVYRGMSWLTPIVQEVQADQAATNHKLKYFENGATPNAVISLDPEVSLEAFEKFQAMFEAKYGDAAASAYKTWFLGGGAKAQVIGTNLQEVSLRETQGAGELRIAMAAGVPPPILGAPGGMETAPYSAYPFARRRMADLTIRPLWRNMAASLSRIVDVPRGSELWYDERDIAFLKEDVKERAEIELIRAQAIKFLTESGYSPKSVVDAIAAEDVRRLDHTGVFSVQLQEPGSPNGADKPPQLPPAQQGRALLEALLPRN
jgi:hypothetical protein